MSFIKLRFVSLDAETRQLISSGGHLPLLDLTLKLTKTWEKVLQHLEKKWLSLRNLRDQITFFFFDIHGNPTYRIAPSLSGYPVSEILVVHPRLLEHEVLQTPTSTGPNNQKTTVSAEKTPMVEVFYQLSNRPYNHLRAADLFIKPQTQQSQQSQQSIALKKACKPKPSTPSNTNNLQNVDRHQQNNYQYHNKCKSQHPSQNRVDGGNDANLSVLPPPNDVNNKAGDIYLDLLSNVAWNAPKATPQAHSQIDSVNDVVVELQDKRGENSNILANFTSLSNWGANSNEDNYILLPKVENGNGGSAAATWADSIEEDSLIHAMMAVENMTDLSNFPFAKPITPMRMSEVAIPQPELMPLQHYGMQQACQPLQSRSKTILCNSTNYSISSQPPSANTAAGSCSKGMSDPMKLEVASSKINSVILKRKATQGISADVSSASSKRSKTALSNQATETDMYDFCTDIACSSNTIDVHFLSELSNFPITYDVPPKCSQYSNDNFSSVHEIEKIIAHRGNSHYSMEFLVKWAGIPLSMNDWEPTLNVSKCRVFQGYLAAHNLSAIVDQNERLQSDNDCNHVDDYNNDDNNSYGHDENDEKSPIHTDIPFCDSDDERNVMFALDIDFSRSFFYPPPVTSQVPETSPSAKQAESAQTSETAQNQCQNQSKEVEAAATFEKPYSKMENQTTALTNPVDKTMDGEKFYQEQKQEKQHALEQPVIDANPSSFDRPIVESSNRIFEHIERIHTSTSSQFLPQIARNGLDISDGTEAPTVSELAEKAKAENDASDNMSGRTTHSSDTRRSNHSLRDKSQMNNIQQIGCDDQNQLGVTEANPSNRNLINTAFSATVTVKRCTYTAAVNSYDNSSSQAGVRAYAHSGSSDSRPFEAPVIADNSIHQPKVAPHFQPVHSSSSNKNTLAVSKAPTNTSQLEERVMIVTFNANSGYVVSSFDSSDRANCRPLTLSSVSARPARVVGRRRVTPTYLGPLEDRHLFLPSSAFTMQH